MKLVKGKAGAATLTAEDFTRRLMLLQSDAELKKIGRYFKTGKGEYAEGDRFIGVRMGALFDLAKEFIEMAPADLERLLESDIHEVRAGALSIMGKQALRKSTTAARQGELFALYLRRHDRINNWDLVDLGAWSVVGPWLLDKPRDTLYALAASADMWERRTAILATFAFIRRGEIGDTLRIAEALLHDPENLIHKAAGGMLREAGKKDPAAHRAFLDRHAHGMPRVMLRYAIEKLVPEERRHYLEEASAHRTSAGT